MNEIKVLTKIMLLQDWGINGFSKKVDENRYKRKLKSILMMILFIMGLCCYLILTYSIILQKRLEEINCEDVLFKLSYIIASIAIMALTIYKTNNELLTISNHSMLKTLPISEKSLILSKIISILLISYFLTILCVIPPVLIYYFNNYGHLIQYFISILICIIFIPFIPMSIGIFITMIINYLMPKKEIKRMFIIIVTIIVLLFMMISSMRVDNILRKIIDEGAIIINNISTYYLTANYFANAITKFEILELVKFILANYIFIALFYEIVRKYFKNFNCSHNNENMNNL